jgi:HPt (histidine-containing phosphotransfer) domain-containing protein/two-component sensor histidine kinase
MTQRRATSHPIQRLRTLILIALAAGVAAFTIVMISLVGRLSERFVAEVRADLEWRAHRGAAELSKTADLGLAVGDAELTREAFGEHTRSSDVLAIVAIDAAGHVIAQHGEVASMPSMFAAPVRTVVETTGQLTAWAPVEIESAVVGKVAIAVSTARLTDAEAMLARVSLIAVLAGMLALVIGALVIVLFTRALLRRDVQLRAYASDLEGMVDKRTRELDERNRGMHLVLDHVAQGFITIGLDGTMAAERSAVVDRWFGQHRAGRTLGDALRDHAPEFAVWLELGLDMVSAGDLPVDVCLAQLPSRFTANERAYDVAYTPISVGERLDRILVVISDVTEQLTRERIEREQRELLAVFQRVTHDRAACEEFMAEASDLIALLDQPHDRLAIARALHTLKGNCGMFGFERFAALCHTIEGELAELGARGVLDDDQRARLVDGWRQVVRTMTGLLGDQPRSVIEVEFAELSALVEQARRGVPSRELATVLTSWTHEPVARRFHRLGKHATGLARRLGKGNLEIAIGDSSVRLDAEHWAPFWNALIHAVRNAVDHGIESPDERTRAGKAEPRLTFAAERRAGELVVTLADNGRGIDWEAVRNRATRWGMPQASQRDLIEALFADGVSTRDQATEVSGRGVGLAALRSAVAFLGGLIDVESIPGQGTCFTFRFPTESHPAALRPPTIPLHRCTQRSTSLEVIRP